MRLQPSLTSDLARGVQQAEIEQPEEHAHDQREHEHRYRRLDRFLAGRPDNPTQLSARGVDETPERLALRGLQPDEHRDPERHEHPKGAQRDGRVAEVVVGDETDERDGDRRHELGRVDYRRFSLYLGFHGLLQETGRGAPSSPRLRGWQARRVSNPQPAVLETAALPIELLAFRSDKLASDRSCCSLACDSCYWRIFATTP